MSNNTTRINVANLDFDFLKASVRDYLRSQDQFKDYNFEGASLSILLDILALNTHYNAFYMGMIGNEMFLDSANLRSSVVSLAKHLNYTPRSVTSSQARVSITLNPTDSASVAVIEKNTPFVSNIGGDTFNFITDRTYGATLDGNNLFQFPDVTLIEGSPFTYRFTVDSTIIGQRFLLPNPSVDTSVLTVRIQTSSTNTILTTFVLADNLLELKGNTNAYFLQEAENQQFEVKFGDGIIGSALIDGNIVVIDYIVSSGDLANGSSLFTPTFPLSGYNLNRTTITTLVPAAGGLPIETIDQIKFSAPKNFEAQGRAVTASDYILHISEQYTNADSVTVWGGEDNIPPQYGKVFISIKPVLGFVVTETAKSLVVQDIVRKINVISVIPEFIDPDYTFIIINCKVKYNPSNTFKTDGDINSGAYNAIVNYAQLALDKFDLEFRYSKLLSAIDDSDASITNNLTTIQMKKIFSPAFEVVTNYDFDVNNGILPGSLSSSSFVVVHDPLLLTPYTNGKTYTFQDDRITGNIQLVEHGIGIPDSVVRICGSINYATGHISLKEFIPFQADADGEISLIMTPQENDIIPVRNNILFIKPEDIFVTVLPNQ